MIDFPIITWATLFLSSILALGPSPSILVSSFITVPLLIQLSRAQGEDRTKQVSIAYSLVLVASSLAYLPTTWRILPGFQSILLQLVFSIVSSGFVILPILSYQLLIERIQDEPRNLQSSQRRKEGRNSKRWMEIASFPVIWMTTWLIFEQINPFGRQVSSVAQLSNLFACIERMFTLTSI
jgi:hypothetical protein